MNFPIRPLPPGVTNQLPSTTVAGQGYASYAPQSEPAPFEIDWSLGRLISAMLTHWRIVLLAMCTSVAFGVLYLVFATRLYTASAALEVHGYMPLLPGTQTERALQLESKDQDYLKTQVAKLERLTVANEVLRSGDIEEKVSEYFYERSGYLSQLLSGIKNLFFISDEKYSDANYSFSKEFLLDYLRLLHVSPVYGTSLIEVGFETADPKLSRDLANAHAEGFIRHLRDERQRNLLAKMEFLRTEGDNLKKRVTEAEEALARYAEKNELISLSKDEDVVVREIGDLTKLLSEATSRRIQSQSILAELEGRDIAETESLDTEAIRRLVVELGSVEADYADLGRKVTPLYPRMQQLNARIKNLRASIESQRKQRLASLKAKYESDKKAEEDLNAQIDEKKKMAHEVSKSQVQYNILKREYESLKDLHQAVIRQLKESQLSSASQGTSVSVAEYAALPNTPSSPKKALVLVFSFCLGCGLGVAIALFREFFRTTLVHPEDAEKALGLSALATIPSFLPDLPRTDVPALSHEQQVKEEPEVKALLVREDDAGQQSQDLDEEQTVDDQQPVFSEGTQTTESILSENNDGEDRSRLELIKKVGVRIGGTVASSVATSVKGNPRQPLAFQAALEAFRNLRTVLLLSADEAVSQVIMITSAVKGEGKTTVMSNLAMAFSQSGQKVLLIDADIRRPQVHKRFGIPDSHAGLIDVLAGQSSFENTIVQHSPHLHVLPAGSLSAHSAELFASLRMRKLLAGSKERYDIVLIDAPPVLPVADSLVLATSVDSVLVVVRSEETKRHLATEAMKKLRSVRANILGLVINDYQGGGDRQNIFRHTYDSDYYIVPSDVGSRKRIHGSDLFNSP